MENDISTPRTPQFSESQQRRTIIIIVLLNRNVYYFVVGNLTIKLRSLQTWIGPQESSLQLMRNRLLQDDHWETRSIFRNSLPLQVRQTECLSTFRSGLKIKCTSIADSTPMDRSRNQGSTSRLSTMNYHGQDFYYILHTEATTSD